MRTNKVQSIVFFVSSLLNAGLCIAALMALVTRDTKLAIIALFANFFVSLLIQSPIVNLQKRRRMCEFTLMKSILGFAMFVKPSLGLLLMVTTEIAVLVIFLIPIQEKERQE